MKIAYIGQRDILNFFELSGEDQTKMKSDFEDKAEEYSYFINEHNEVELFEFMRIEHNEKLKSFDGYSSDSFFSGSLVILSKDCQTFKLFRYIS